MAAVAGLLFFLSLGRLWPLAATDLTVPRSIVQSRAEQALRSLGIGDPADARRRYTAATRIAVDEAALDYVERTFGRDSTQRLVREGASLVT